MSPLMEHGSKESGPVGQCFGSVNNSRSNRSFVSICAGSAALPRALFHQLLQGQRGLICPPQRHPHTWAGCRPVITYSEEVWTVLFLKPGNNLTTLLTCIWVSSQVVSFLSHRGGAAQPPAEAGRCVVLCARVSHLCLSFQQVDVKS